MMYKDYDVRGSGEDGDGDLLEGAAPEALEESEDENEDGILGAAEEEEEKWE